MYQGTKGQKEENEKDENDIQKERTQTREACVFTTLGCVSRDRELSEVLPQSISINKS